MTRMPTPSAISPPSPDSEAPRTCHGRRVRSIALREHRFWRKQPTARRCRIRPSQSLKVSRTGAPFGRLSMCRPRASPISEPRPCRRSNPQALLVSPWVVEHAECSTSTRMRAGTLARLSRTTVKLPTGNCWFVPRWLWTCSGYALASSTCLWPTLTAFIAARTREIPGIAGRLERPRQTEAPQRTRRAAVLVLLPPTTCARGAAPRDPFWSWGWPSDILGGVLEQRHARDSVLAKSPKPSIVAVKMISEKRTRGTSFHFWFLTVASWATLGTFG